MAEESNGAGVRHDLGPLDSAHVFSLNNAHAMETSELDEERLAALLRMAFYARGIDGGATAFLIASRRSDRMCSVRWAIKRG